MIPTLPATARPPYDPATDLSNVDTCHRSPSAYSLLTSQATAGTFNSNVALAACNGDVSNQMIGTVWTEGSQLAALGADTKLVTLTIGGNDVNFAGVLQDCVEWTATNPFHQCSADYPNLPSQIQAEQQQLVIDYTTIASLAPNAVIVVLTYPLIFPQNMPVNAACPITPLDVNWAWQQWDAFDSKIKQAALLAAQQTGRTIVVRDEENAFAGHLLCDNSSDAWANGVFLGSRQLDSFHPNAEGYVKEAADLSSFLTSLGIN